jgi:hypothetical protein
MDHEIAETRGGFEVRHSVSCGCPVPATRLDHPIMCARQTGPHRHCGRRTGRATDQRVEFVFIRRNDAG